MYARGPAGEFENQRRKWGLGRGSIGLIGACLIASACEIQRTETMTSPLQPQDDGNAGAQGAGGMSMTDAAQLYWMPIEGGNNFACSNCHALEEPAMDMVRRAGHEIGTATTRTSFKNGLVDNMLEAVNSCLTEWMAMPTEWTEDTPDWQALSGFLAAMNTGGGAPEISYTIAAPLTGVAVIGGDADRGQGLFNISCVECHGANATGTSRAPSLDGARLAAGKLAGAAAYVATRVRTSGNPTPFYPGLTGGRMPFWAADRLSDDELRDVGAFLATNVVTASGGGPGPAEAPVLRTCEATHEKIGEVTEFSGPFAANYGVAGQAVIIDDCTVELQNFNFGGSGAMVVEIYGGSGNPPNYRSGFSMSRNLFGPELINVTMPVQLPIDKTLDDLDGISVWCVSVGQDFGSGAFGPPG